MNNPFEQINDRLSNIENLLLSIKHPDPLELGAGENPLNVQQTAELLHLSVATIYGLVHRRAIPYNKRGKKLYFFKSELDTWIKETRRKTEEEIRNDARFNKGGKSR